MAHIKRRDYENHADSLHGFRALKVQLDEKLSKKPLASSTFHTRKLPVNLCKEIVSRYSVKGWDVSFTVTEAGTTFTFLR